MIMSPDLLSFAIVPKEKYYAKIIHAHTYLRENPVKMETIINSTNHPTKKAFFNVKFFVDGITDCNELLDFLFKWKLVDIIDLNSSKPQNSFKISFRSAVSAHTLSKLPGVKVILMDDIPKNARVPRIFIQGIPASTSNEEIEKLFEHITPILKITAVQKNGFEGHVIKVPTVDIALRTVEMAQKMRFGETQLTVSHQYKSAITNCIVINTLQGTRIPLADVLSEVSKFGKVTESFCAFFAGLDSIALKMSSENDAKLACGFMKNRIYDGSQINSVFIEEKYFNDLKNQQMYQSF